MRITVNGRVYDIAVHPSRTLLDVLRHDLHLTGTKKGCASGDCGVCTVLMDGQAVTACLVPIAEVEGKEITTIEGLAHGVYGVKHAGEPPMIPELAALANAVHDATGVRFPELPMTQETVFKGIAQQRA